MNSNGPHLVSLTQQLFQYGVARLLTASITPTGGVWVLVHGRGTLRLLGTGQRRGQGQVTAAVHLHAHPCYWTRGEKKSFFVIKRLKDVPISGDGYHHGGGVLRLLLAGHAHMPATGWGRGNLSFFSQILKYKSCAAR